MCGAATNIVAWSPFLFFFFILYFILENKFDIYSYWSLWHHSSLCDEIRNKTRWPCPKISESSFVFRNIRCTHFIQFNFDKFNKLTLSFFRQPQRGFNFSCSSLMPIVIMKLVTTATPISTLIDTKRMGIRNTPLKPICNRKKYEFIRAAPVWGLN